MERKRYSLTSEERIRYAGILILDYMTQKNITFPILLKGEDLNLEPILQNLCKSGFVEIYGQNFGVTEKGRKEVDEFFSGYSKFLKEFEVYQAVDLEAGEFAWSSYYDFETDEDFQDFLNQERWEDVRFAVAEYQNHKKFLKWKLLNPVENVFVSFMEESRFDFSESGWQTKILSGQIWDEILEIGNSMLQWQDFGGEDVIKDIINQGKQLTKQLS
jgi:hypothetical protein